MSLVAKNFSVGAASYDKTARIQPAVAARLAGKLQGAATRVLEIGCGTGGLSQHLVRMFPEAELVLTDIALPMLKICERRVGSRALYQVMDGQNPDAGLGTFDLIVSSLAMQWLEDLQGVISRLAGMLKPGGTLAFAVLGEKNFPEWRALLDEQGIDPGLHHYPKAELFPWPDGLEGKIEEEFLEENHASGAAFLKSLKVIGAGAPRAGYEPVRPAQMRRLLAATADGFAVTYHVLYGSLTLR